MTASIVAAEAAIVLLEQGLPAFINLMNRLNKPMEEVTLDDIKKLREMLKYASPEDYGLERG